MRVSLAGLLVATCAWSAANAEPSAFAPFPSGPVIPWAVENLDMIPAAHVWTDDDLVVWVKRETIQRTGNSARAWFVWEAASQVSVDRQGGRSVVVLKEFRCKEGQSRTLALSVYRGNNQMGGLVGSYDVPTAWTYDRPGMMGEAQRITACERDFDKELEEAAAYFRSRAAGNK